MYPDGFLCVTSVTLPSVSPVRSKRSAYCLPSEPTIATAMLLRIVDLPTPLSPRSTFQSVLQSSSRCLKGPMLRISTRSRRAHTSEVDGAATGTTLAVRDAKLARNASTSEHSGETENGKTSML